MKLINFDNYIASFWEKKKKKIKEALLKTVKFKLRQILSSVLIIPLSNKI